MRKALVSMPTSQDVSRLLHEAALATDPAEAKRLVAEAENAQNLLKRQAQANREVDLASTIVRERMTPVPVYSRVTAASDWLGELDTSVDTAQMANQLTAEAALWYGKISPEVKADAAEFTEQVKGRALAVCGSYAEHAEAARAAFIEQMTELRSRDLRTGAIKEAASTLPQVGEQGYPSDAFATGNYDAALPLEATTSERAPQIQELEATNGATPSQESTMATGDAGTQQDRSEMTNNQRSASRHEAYSGLDQIQQTVDPSDTHLQPTPLNPEVAFPWVTSPQNVNQVIAETEQQLAERDQRRGAALKAVEAARRAYAQVMTAAGYDASGWAGDMGAQGYGPGQQEGPPPPGHNLGQPDPVYGYGGDQGDKPLKPYGADEASDYTNNPGMDYQPGDDAHYDVGQSGASATQRTSAKHHGDPEIQRALKFIAQRKAWLDGKSC